LAALGFEFGHQAQLADQVVEGRAQAFDDLVAELAARDGEALEGVLMGAEAL